MVVTMVVVKIIATFDMRFARVIRALCNGMQSMTFYVRIFTVFTVYTQRERACLYVFSFNENALNPLNNLQ